MSKLVGSSVLVVEDDSAVAMLIEDMLEELGCRVVASVPRLAKAFDLVETLDFDVAILDVNVAGEPVFPLASRLQALGKPIVFSTGYGRAGLPADFSRHAVLAKPFSIGELRQALEGGA